MAGRALIRYLVLSVLLPVMASGVQVLYRHIFDSDGKCLGRPTETFPVAIIDRCFVSCAGNVPRHQTMDSNLCRSYYGPSRLGEWTVLLMLCIQYTHVPMVAQKVARLSGNQKRLVSASRGRACSRRCSQGSTERATEQRRPTKYIPVNIKLSGQSSPYTFKVFAWADRDISECTEEVIVQETGSYYEDDGITEAISVIFFTEDAVASFQDTVTFLLCPETLCSGVEEDDDAIPTRASQLLQDNQEKCHSANAPWEPPSSRTFSIGAQFVRKKSEPL
eukprot:8241319-Pyramimonas_sp.AAC.1